MLLISGVLLALNGLIAGHYLRRPTVAGA